MEVIGSGPNFIIKDLASVLIVIIAHQILNDSLCCSNKYKWCLCRFISKLYILYYDPDKIVRNLYKFAWNILIKSKPDYSIMSGVAQWVARDRWIPVSREFEPHQRPPVVSLSKKRYCHCLVLVGSRHGFERDLHKRKIWFVSQLN